MAILQPYSAFLVRHPGKLLIATTTSVVFLFLITLWLRPFQSFNDPLVGFVARGTPLGLKLNTWKLLNDETSASANNISLLPNWSRYDGSYNQVNWNRVEDPIRLDPANYTDPEPPLVESSIQQDDKTTGNASFSQDEILDEGEAEYYRMINSTRNIQPVLVHHSLGSSKAFCGKLYEGYAQAVVSPSSSYASQGLFNIDSLRAVCQLDRRLRLEHAIDEMYLFQDVCERYQDEHKNETGPTCCNSWSLPNYIACLNDRPSCMDISFKDLKVFEQLLDLCVPHYLRVPYEECFGSPADNMQTLVRPMSNFLAPDLSGNEPKSFCGTIPGECLKCGGWTFNVLHYLTSDNFLRYKTPMNVVNNEAATNRLRMPSNRLSDMGAPKEINVNKLSHTNIFLPTAKSASLMKYYLALAKHNLKTPYAQVKVLNLGLKNSLFEHLISDDMKLFIIALVSILLVISIYTWSFVLSLVILLIICLSLCLSYAIYELVLNIAVFPFMNLLAVVISFGICSDNAMLFCKHWSLSRGQSTIEHQRKNTSHHNGVMSAQDSRDHASLDLMLRKAVLSTSAATLATACSFVISAISQVTAVRCFCIFATLSVITNYLLIIILLPPALILDARLQDFIEKFIGNKNDRLTKLSNRAQVIRGKILELGEYVHMRVIFLFITRFKFYLIITFITLFICSSILVFHGPTLQPAEDDIQLLTRKHAFEQYDKNLRRQFAFERAKQSESISATRFTQDSPETLPIRVVFGLKPEDNGDHFDPHDRGTIVFDPSFDIGEPNAQIWLLEFCQKMRNQRFVHPPAVTDMSNCFIDTFKSWMETRTCKDPVHPEVDRSPCCQSVEFPFSRYTFNKCMIEAIGTMRRSPHLYPNINAGIRFRKNSTRVVALIVEYQSNRIYTESFSKMERFYSEINDWVSWHINNTAPPSMKSGWFISSHLDLFALQIELEQSTNMSVLLEVLFAMFALLISTRDIFLTLAGTLTICTIIIVILAILILLKWTLGVTESILISLTIGLSIDFALHYAVAYSEGTRSRLSNGVIQRILNEVGSPIALATITTTLAGFVIVWSDILAYQELGTFLMLIALVSWPSSTLFLLPMLATFDSIRELSEQYVGMFLLQAQKMLIDRYRL